MNDDFLQLFLGEAEGRLSSLGVLLLDLERSPDDEDLIKGIFREAHTIKGSASVVGLTDVTRVAHALEDVLEELRAGRRAADPSLIDAMLEVVDGLSRVIPDSVEGADVSSAANVLIERISSTADGAPAVAEASISDIQLVGNEGSASDSNESVLDLMDVQEAPVEPNGRRMRSNETINVHVERIDELIRLVGETASAHLRLARGVQERFSIEPAELAEFHELSLALNVLQEKTMRTRMVPVATATDPLRRAVRELARSLGKRVRWEVRGEDTELDRGVLQQLSDPLLHLVRNAVDHGIESPEDRKVAGKSEEGVVRLHAMQLGSEVTIALSDDGGGIDFDLVRQEAARNEPAATAASDEETRFMIFRSGLSTAGFVSDVSGRGVGLDVVRSHLEAVRGRIEVVSEKGQGSEFRVIVPITMAVLRCLLVRANGQRYAIPMHAVVRVTSVDSGEELSAEGRQVIWEDGHPVPIADLSQALGEPAETGGGALVVIGGLTRRFALRVDELIGQHEVVVKPLGGVLPLLEAFAGAYVEPDGSVVLVIDPAGIIERARLIDRSVGVDVVEAEVGLPIGQKGRVLVVDDALTVRELQRSILERAGYEVVVAMDGKEALTRLAEGPFDLVLSDIEMPRMDGFELTESIRSRENLAGTSILILTSRASEADKQRAMDVGADGYIVKSAFNAASLLSAVERLMGKVS
jgi:two-component system, chemotaxis family, sensor kinase CheA